MTRFILGAIAALLAHAIGWARIEHTARAIGDAARVAYVAAESELRSAEAGK